MFAYGLGWVLGNYSIDVGRACVVNAIKGQVSNVW